MNGKARTTQRGLMSSFLPSPCEKSHRSHRERLMERRKDLNKQRVCARLRGIGLQCLVIHSWLSTVGCRLLSIYQTGQKVGFILLSLVSSCHHIKLPIAFYESNPFSSGFPYAEIVRWTVINPDDKGKTDETTDTFYRVSHTGERENGTS